VLVQKTVASSFEHKFPSNQLQHSSALGAQRYASL
jgi:hypothetical protein